MWGGGGGVLEFSVFLLSFSVILKPKLQRLLIKKISKAMPAVESTDINKNKVQTRTKVIEMEKGE